jgi:alpha-N-arabinofuranosidase
VDGGIWAELLKNRRFDLADENGDGVSDPWLAVGAQEGAEFSLEDKNPFSGMLSQKIVLRGESEQPRGLKQTGQRILFSRRYRGSLFLKGQDFRGRILIALANGPQALYALATLDGIDNQWRRYEFTLNPGVHDPRGEFLILLEGTGTVWLDAASLMAADHQDGMVRQVVSFLKDARTPTVRFPGGCYADVYHFEQALGDRDRRAMTWDPQWRKWDTNDFGTDEFLNLCRILGAEPNLTVNFGSGTPREAANWVEYCNGSQDTPYGRKRAENGHPEPYGVKYWSIGNELWGCGGRFTVQEYVAQLPEWVAAMKAVDPTIVLAVNGAPRGVPPERWDEPLVRAAADHVDWYSLHYYFPSPVVPVSASKDEIYRAIVGNPVALERSLLDFRHKMDSWGNGSKLKLTLDEWNVTIPNDRMQEIPNLYRRRKNDYEKARDERLGAKLSNHWQNSNFSLREGLFTSGVFHMFYRLSNELIGGNIFSSVNQLGAIETNGLETYATPVALAYGLYARHSGSKVVESSTRIQTYDVAGPGWGGKMGDIPYLDVVATLSEDGRSLYLHAINRHKDETIRARINISGFVPGASGRVYALNGPDPTSSNDYLHPDVVSIRRSSFAPSGNAFDYVFPAHSATTLEMDRK